MDFVSTGVATSLNGHQIQKSIHKLGFVLAGVKAAGTEAIDQAIADAKLAFVSLKRVDGTEAPGWSRMSLYELIQAATAVEGHVKVRGTLAATTYTLAVWMELNEDGAYQLSNGKYLELNIENAVANLNIHVKGVGHRRKAYSMLVIERVQVAAGEEKTVDMVSKVYGSYARKVLVPASATELKFNCRDNSFNETTSGVEAQAQEKQQAIQNYDTGVIRMADYGAFTADSIANIGDEILSVEIQGGPATSSVLILREV